jgi:hypothetical protein
MGSSQEDRGPGHLSLQTKGQVIYHCRLNDLPTKLKRDPKLSRTLQRGVTRGAEPVPKPGPVPKSFVPKSFDRLSPCSPDS